MSAHDPELFRTVNTWLHFIGGYYADTDRFIAEARRQGISRRAPAQVVRGMEFGDRLILLRYAKDASTAFAEARITGVMLEHEIAQEVGEKLASEGKAEYSAGGSMITRECGSYMITGGWRVTATLTECIDHAIEAAAERGISLFVMVNAVLTIAYSDPIILQPSPKFTRSFTRAKEDQIYMVSEDPEPVGTVYGVRDYSKNPRPARSARPPMLPAGAGAEREQE